MALFRTAAARTIVSRSPARATRASGGVARIAITGGDWGKMPGVDQAVNRPVSWRRGSIAVVIPLQLAVTCCMLRIYPERLAVALDTHDPLRAFSRPGSRGKARLAWTKRAYSPLPARAPRHYGAGGRMGWQRCPVGDRPGVQPGLGVVEDAGKQPAQLNRGRQLALLEENGTDGGGFGFGDAKYGRTMAFSAAADKRLRGPTTLRRPSGLIRGCKTRQWYPASGNSFAT